MDFTPLMHHLEGYLRQEKDVPSVDIIVMQNHKELFRYMSGTTDKNRTKPVTADDLYYIYSCTKPMTCAAALQLVEQGKLGLDDPVCKYLPAYRDAFLLKDGEKVTVGHTMTVRHLFTMSAGLNYKLKASAVVQKLKENPMASTRQLVDCFVQSPLEFAPGEKFNYSLCHDVLAAVVEAASGLRFSQYLQKNIWEPLGMKRTGFHPAEAEEENLVWHFKYSAVEDKVLPKREKVCNYCLGENYDSGGAGLFTATEEYVLFADAMACGGVGKNGRRILKSETVDLMRQDQTGIYSVPYGTSGKPDPGYGYGLGVRTLVSKGDGQRSAIGEFGWDGAAGSYILMDPAHKLSVFFTMSVTNWVPLLGRHTALRDAVYESLGIE